MSTSQQVEAAAKFLHDKGWGAQWCDQPEDLKAVYRIDAQGALDAAGVGLLNRRLNDLHSTILNRGNELARLYERYRRLNAKISGGQE